MILLYRVNYHVDLNLFCDGVACMVTERCVDLFTAVLSVSNNSSRDSDSGLGVSADVIVFGKEIENIGRSMSKALSVTVVNLDFYMFKSCLDLF